MGGPDVGAAGILIIFFSVLIAEILACLLVFSFATQVFLVALIGTAAGADEVEWPNDHFYDWFLRVWHFIWLLAVWFVPAFFVMKLFNVPKPVFVAGTVAMLWLVFPVTVLSSLSATSNWVIFRPVILRAMLKRFGTLAGFYVSTGLLLAICTGLWYIGVLTDYGIVLPVAAIAGALGFIIYARLLGRIGLIVSWYKPGRRGEEPPPPEDADKVQIFDPWGLPQETENQKVAETPRPPRQSKKRLRSKKKRKQPNDSAYDPWATPPEELQESAARTTSVSAEPEDPLGPVSGSYDMAAEDAPPPLPLPKAELPDPNLEGYSVAEPRGDPIAPIDVMGSPAVAKRELEYAIKRRPPLPPAKPLTTGVYNFPFYQQCLMPLGALSIGFLIVGGLLRLLIELFPPFWREG